MMIQGTSKTADDMMQKIATEFYSHPAFGDTFDVSHKHIRRTMDSSSPDNNKPMLELPFIWTIEDPRDRLIYCKSTDLYNLAGLWIYLLSGSEAVDPINYYNPIARRFVDEEVSTTRLRASWGNRLFATGAVSRTIELLKASPETRRAVIPVLQTEDVGYSSRNLPCLSSIQFAVQAGRLNAYVTMRSQAAVGVLPYDLFLLTMLQEFVAMRVNIPLGSYTTFMPLCGIRENEIPIIKEMSKAVVVSSDGPMPAMEPLLPGHLALFLFCERQIRNGKLPQERFQLPGYWQDFLVITFCKKQLRMVAHKELKTISAFPPDFVERFIERENTR